MVTGIDKFREYFADFNGSYVIIGGTACDIIEEEAGQTPRATKDIDIILIIEALTPEFVRQFWNFIAAGSYTTRQRSNGTNEYFRFLKPQTKGFPLQIELFSRKPDVLDAAEASTLTPIPVDDDLSSLSAILMNDQYYSFTLEHSQLADDIRIAKSPSLICLKAKAYLDLSDRKAKGEKVDEKNIRKHLNDVFRLAAALAEADQFYLPDEIKADLTQFCQIVSKALPDGAIFRAAGLASINSKDVFDRLCAAFQVNLQ